MENDGYIEKIQEQINKIIGTNSTLKRRKKTREDAQRELFINLIPLLEHAIDRSIIIENDFNINLSKYDELFFQIIDSLIYLHFSKNAAEMIMYYLYDRTDAEGNIINFVDFQGREIAINSPQDLWELVKMIEKQA